jgi:hypothetical protein
MEVFLSGRSDCLVVCCGLKMRQRWDLAWIARRANGKGSEERMEENDGVGGG